MAGKAFNNLNKIFLSDTFRAWFDKTNQIVNTLNPLEIYGVTAGEGEIAGLTMEFGTDGIVTIGLDLPGSLTGDFTFTSGVTFENFVSVTGLTIDIGHSGHGATMYGRVVRTVNGATGDINLNFLAAPGTSSDGDILYYENTGAGATWRAYNLFSDGTADNGMMHIGGSGGVFFGITAGGASSANEFVKLGNIQLVGTTASGIYMVDNSQATLSTAKIAGADIRYGTEGSSQLLSIGGRNISGVEHGTKNLILDFNRQSIVVGGAALSSVGTTTGIVDIRDEGDIGIPIQYTDTSGSTFAIKYLTAGETAGGLSGGGEAGLAHFQGHPATKGLLGDKRIRLANVAGSVEVELVGSGKTSGFAVYGQKPEYGNALLPAMLVRRDGDVVIGGIRAEDGGITGTTYGALNIASGKLRVGGSAGAVVSSGYQVLHSTGTSTEWKLLESTAFSYSGNISTPLNAVVSEATATGTDVSISDVSSLGQTIVFKDKTGQQMTGPYSGTVNFPLVKLNGTAAATTKGLLGIRIITDGIVEDKIIKWEDFAYNTITNGGPLDYRVSPTFTFQGNASSSLRIIPFMTVGPAYGLNQSFTFINRGTYLVNFHKLG